ncbi:MAG: M43 family zinc metalloprotease [Bacteroidota bacterium]
MKFTLKFIKTSVFISVFGFLSFAQQIKVQEKQHISHEKCGFSAKHEQKLQNDPVYLQKTLDFEERVKNFVPNKAVATYKIPVVVHVMETGTALTSITDQQIKDAILNLNLRLRKITGSAGDGNGVDSGIEYVLAVRDPSGNCTNGITRFDMTGNATYMSEGVDYSSGQGITDAELKAEISWDQNEYYNIWLVSEFEDNDGGAGIQGYAYFASSHGQSEDGAVMLVNNMKNPSSTTLTHELGHSLNLYHTFEGDGTGNNCPTNTSCSTQGDRCCDTPPHKRSSSDCVVANNTCTGTSSNLHIHNYMDYSADDCQDMFSADQRTRMQAAISGTRSSFLESNGNMALVPVSPSVVDFNSSKTILCGTGQNVTLYDLSSCSPNTFMTETAWTGTSYSWNITNGTNTYTSTSQNPTINFANAGNFSVTLTITTPEGSASLTKTDYIIVSSSPVSACTPGSFNPSGNYGYAVSNVTFNTINNTTSSGTNGEYEDFSCSKNTIVTEGTTHQLSVTINGGSSTERFEAYIDYNNDGDFADAGELIGSGSTTSSATINTNVTIPLTAVENTILRLRVIGELGTIIASERTCSAEYSVGDVEDYGVLIVSSCSAPVVTTQPSNSTNCSSTNTSFTVANTNGGTYQWQVNTGAGFTNITNDATYSGATSATLNLTSVQASMNAYLYKCVIANGCGSATSNSATLTVNTTTNPTVSISQTGGDAFLCTGLRSDMSSNTQNVTASVSGYTIAPTYQWQIGGVNVGTNSNSITLNGLLSTSNLVCIVTSNDACPSSAVLTSNTHTANVVQNPGGPFISASGSTSLCSGNSVNISITNPDGVSIYSWSEGSLNTMNINVNTAGNFTARASNNVCYTESNVISTTLTATPATPTISASGATTFCQGGSVVLTSSSASGNLWSTGATSQSITVSTTSSNTVAVTTGGCSSASSSSTDVTVNPNPVIAEGTLTNPSACLVNDGSIQITGSGTGNLSWSGTASGSMMGVTLPTTISSLGSGTYSISFDNGCVSNTISSTLINPGAPVISFGSITPPFICQSTDARIVINGSGTGDLSYVTASNSTPVVFTNVTLPYDHFVPFASASSSITYTFVSNGCISNSISNGLDAQMEDPSGIGLSITENGQPTTFCDGDNVDLSTSTSLGNYRWFHNGNEIIGETTAALTAAQTGDYYVTGDLGSCTNWVTSNTISVTVNPIPATPTISSSGSTTFCEGESIVLTSSNPSGNLWGAGETSQSITVTSGGTYSVSTSLNGCLSGSASEIITVNPIPATPTISAGGSINLCTGENVVLTSTSSSGNIWSTGETTQSITVNTTGTYSVTEVANACLSLTSNSINVIANSTPSTPTISVSGATTFCEGGSIVLTSSNPSGNLWDAGETSQSITVTSGGTYSVSTALNGCLSGSASEIVTVNPIPATPTISASGSVTLCTGENVVLTSTASSGNVWSTGETTPSITVNTAGTYTVTEVANTCSSATSNSIDVVVNSTPTVPTISTSGSTTICEGQSVTLTSSATLNNLWSTTSESTQSIIVSTSGSYSVTSGTGNCTATSSTIDVVVNTNPIVSLSPIADMCNTVAPFTLNNGLPTNGVYTVDGSTQTVFNPSINTGSNTIVYTFTDLNSCSSSDTQTVVVNDCSAISEGSKLLFNVYPNPTNSNIVLEGDKLLEVNSLELRDELGRLVQTFKGNKSSITIDLSPFSDGIYTLTLKGLDFEEIQKVQILK